MNIINWNKDECPLCGGRLVHDSEEYACNTYSILWMCCECGARVNDIYRYAESEVYTKEEWEA